MLASFLNWEIKYEVTLLGIQPASNDIGETIHLGVSKAVEMIVDVICESFFVVPSCQNDFLEMQQYPVP